MNKKIITITSIIFLAAATMYVMLSSLPTNNISGHLIEQLEKSPSQIYKEYKKAIDATNNFDAYLDVMLNYSSVNYLSTIKKMRKSAEEVKEFAFKYEKKFSPKLSQITSITESIENNIAVLNVSTSRPDITGEVRMIKENNNWKVLTDKWEELKKKPTNEGGIIQVEDKLIQASLG